MDADFGGLWGSENEQDPISVKSRTGFFIMFMGCPLLWISRLQTRIVSNTMESGYVALSQSMRDIISAREIFKEMYAHVLDEDTCVPSYSTKHRFGSLPQSKVYEDNKSRLKFAFLPKMAPRTKDITIPYHFF